MTHSEAKQRIASELVARGLSRFEQNVDLLLQNSDGSWPYKLTGQLLAEEEQALRAAVKVALVGSDQPI